MRSSRVRCFGDYPRRGPIRKACRASRFAEHQIDHPAAANVRPRPAAVVEDVVAVAPGVLERVGQDRHRGEVAGVVHLRRAARRRWRCASRGSKVTGRKGLPKMSCNVDTRSVEPPVADLIGIEIGAVDRSRNVGNPTRPRHCRCREFPKVRQAETDDCGSTSMHFGSHIPPSVNGERKVIHSSIPSAECRTGDRTISEGLCSAESLPHQCVGKPLLEMPSHAQSRRRNFRSLACPRRNSTIGAGAIAFTPLFFRHAAFPEYSPHDHTARHRQRAAEAVVDCRVCGAP